MAGGLRRLLRRADYISAPPNGVSSGWDQLRSSVPRGLFCLPPFSYGEYSKFSSTKWTILHTFIYFSIPFVILALLVLLPLTNCRNSEPGSYRRLFLSGSRLDFFSREGVSTFSLVDSRRIVPGTHAIFIRPGGQLVSFEN